MEITSYLLEVLLLSGTSNARASALAAEVASLSSTSNVRASQLVIEWASYNLTENVFASQLVIEWPILNNTGSFSFWADAEMQMTGTMSWTDFGD